MTCPYHRVSQLTTESPEIGAPMQMDAIIHTVHHCRHPSADRPLVFERRRHTAARGEPLPCGNDQAACCAVPAHWKPRRLEQLDELLRGGAERRGEALNLARDLREFVWGQEIQELAARALADPSGEELAALVEDIDDAVERFRA